jgi:hypothetical protein
LRVVDLAVRIEQRFALVSTDLERLRCGALLHNIRAFSLYCDPETRSLRRVNYGALDVEELGSVYESLLDYRPVITGITPEMTAYMPGSATIIHLNTPRFEMAAGARRAAAVPPPYVWDEERRAVLRAELDARIARLYGLTRDELRYILDPADGYGEEFPGETFRVLKEKETRLYGEYWTRRLVLEAWDAGEEG